MSQRRLSLPARAKFGALLSLALLASASTSGAQVEQYENGYAKDEPDAQFDFVPAVPFTWSANDTYLGPVRIPVGNGGGWIVTEKGQWRLVPSLTGDATFEVILFPPYSGHPTVAERFLLQVPTASNGELLPAKALLVAFHAYNVTELNCFQGTQLPTLCTERGWMLLSPYGLSQVNFANVNSQNALDATLDVVAQAFQFDSSRIYTMGFSMGGMSAVSWAMRSQDKSRFRAAGVIDHTGTMDAPEAFASGTGDLKAKLADTVHFNGTPTTDPFAYDRVSPIQLDALDNADPTKSPVASIAGHIPFYIHYNTLDPNLDLLIQTQALIAFLQSKGATLEVTTAAEPGTHWWSTMDQADALDWIGRFSLPPDPPAVDMFADRRAAYLYASVLDLPTDSVARFKLELGAGNSFDLDKTKNLDKLELDLPAMGKDPSQFLVFAADSADSTTDVLVLKGYVNPPSSVFEDGFAATWTHHPKRQELVIHPVGVPSLFTVAP